MPQSLSKVLLHTVFSTKYRQKLIRPKEESKLYAYMAGIIKELNGNPFIIGGVEDHIHILSTLPRTITIAEYVKVIKARSSKFLKTLDPHYESFAWQRGYATFSVSRFGKDIVVRYIANQKAHHGRQTFKEELVQTLDENDIEYDERYLWD